MSLITKTTSLITDYITSFITFLLSLYTYATTFANDVKEVVLVVYPVVTSKMVFYFWVVDFILPERFRWVVRGALVLYILYIID